MGWLSSLVDSYNHELQRRKNRPFLQAVMAAAAMVASADGEVSFSERVRLDQIIESLEQLDVFDPHEAVEIFQNYTEAILTEHKVGHDKAVADMLAAAEDKECAELIVRVCLAIMNADREPALADQVEIVTICSHLGVEPHNLGLYVDDLD